MILSRTFARRRIAAGVRPGWFAAWGLVMLDALILFPVLLGLAFVVSRHFYMIRPTHWAVAWSSVVTFFIPLQIGLILSSLWAAKSRWEDKPGKGDDA